MWSLHWQLWVVAAACKRTSAGASQGPCDILGTAGNPCVAAHSTVRALYARYDGPLYSVFRNQSNAAADIHVLEPGGFANVTQHEAICPIEGECVIVRVVDQSGNGNHLAPRDESGIRWCGEHPGSAACLPGGPNVGKHGVKHKPVDASKHKIHVGKDST